MYANLRLGLPIWKLSIALSFQETENSRMELQVTVDYTCTDGLLQAKHNYRLAGQPGRIQ